MSEEYRDQSREEETNGGGGKSGGGKENESGGVAGPESVTPFPEPDESTTPP